MLCSERISMSSPPECDSIEADCARVVDISDRSTPRGFLVAGRMLVDVAVPRTRATQDLTAVAGSGFGPGCPLWRIRSTGRSTSLKTATNAMPQAFGLPCTSAVWWRSGFDASAVLRRGPRPGCGVALRQLAHADNLGKGEGGGVDQVHQLMLLIHGERNSPSVIVQRANSGQE